MPSNVDTLFDKRTVERNLRAGRITRREYEEYLAGLGDATPKSQPLFTEDPDAADGDRDSDRF